MTAQLRVNVILGGHLILQLDIHHRDYCSRAVAPPISSWAAYVWCVLPYHISSSVNLINRSLFTLSHHINTRNPPTHTPLDLYTCLWKVEILLSAASTRLVEKLVPAPLERFTWVNWTLFFYVSIPFLFQMKQLDPSDSSSPDCCCCCIHTTWLNMSLFFSYPLLTPTSHTLHCRLCARVFNRLTVFTLGTNITSGEDIGIKLESVRAAHPQLEYEARVYKTLAGGVGIPFCRWYGKEGEYNVLVMDLLGPSLED